MSQSFVVTIDGPAGAGKSTVAQLVARQLGYLYLDTGAIYRTVALAGLKQGVDWGDEKRMGEVARSLVEDERLRLESTEQGQRVFLDGEDVSEAIRTQEVSRGASQVSAHPSVREALLDLQRAMAERGPVVVEGRDTGTVVFPDAPAKFFLTASIEERARRRYEQLLAAGHTASLPELIQQVAERDERDMKRPVAPLRKADDAREIDCSTLSADEVVEIIVNHVHSIAAKPSRAPERD